MNNNSQFSTLNSQLQNRSAILLIEDNPDIMKINRSALATRGYRIVEAESIGQGRKLLESENPDLIILDILLPDGSGLDFCEELRRDSNIPVLFLSALGRSRDIVNGLMRGGDDYLSKPYDLDVLLARVEALLRRAGPKLSAIIIVGAMKLDTVSQRVTVSGEDIILTPKEFAILLYLARHEGSEVRTERLYEAAWRQPMANDPNAVKIAVSRLRKKIEPFGLQIATVRGSGYRFEK